MIENLLPGPVPPSGILVDAFGTIVEADPPWPTVRLECLRDAAAAADVPFARFLPVYDEERLHDHRRAPGDWREFDFPDRFARVFRALDVEDPKAAGEEAARRYYAFQGRLIAPTADAEAGLDALAALGPLVLASNYPDGPTLVAALRRLGLARRFRDFVVSAEVGYLKPHARVFLEGARKLGLPPAACAMVGNDAHDDVGGARGVGMPAVLVPYPRGTEHGVPDGALGVAGDLVEAARILARSLRHP